MMAGCEVGKYAGIFWRGNTGSQASRKKCPVLKKVCLSRQKHVCVERLGKQKIAKCHIFLYFATIVFNQLEL